MRDRLPILSWLFYVGLTAVTLAFSSAIPNAFTGPKVVAALLGAALVAPAVAHHYKRFSPIFLLQFLALVISTVFSLNPAVSLWGGDWRRMGLITWMAILIVGAAVPLVIDSSKIRWTQFLRFVVVTGSIGAAYGVLQWLNLDPFLPASLRAQLVQEFGGVYRSIGTIGQPTYFANYLLYPFFCALALLRFDAALRWRRFAGIAAGVVFAALLTTMSRGAILGACVGLVILGSAAANRRRVVAGFALAIVLALAGGTALLYTQAYGPQLQSRLDYIAKDATGGGRLQLWGDVAQRILPEFWLHGTGSGMFRPAFALERSDRYTAFGPDVHWETAHNIFLDRWTEQGIAGLAMLAVFIATVVSNMRKALRQTSDSRERWALTAVLCAFVSACIGNLFNGEVIVTAQYLCLWAGLSFATVECFGSGRSAFGPQTASKATALRFAAAATVSCLLIWHAGNNWRAEKNLALAIQASERGNEAQLLDAGRASAEVFPERGAYALEFSNALLRFVSKKSLSAERRREIAEIGIDYGTRATSGDRSMLAFYYIAELGTIAGDPRTETWLRRLIAVDPNWYRPHKLLASWLLARQRIPEARAEIQLAQHFSPYDAESAALGTQIGKILQAPAASPSDSEQKRLVQALNRVPLTFESNQEQADSQFEFLTRTRNYTAYLNRAEAIFVGNASGKTSDVFKMRFLGANAILAGTGVDQQSGRANYYMGSDPSKWRVNVPMFGKVAYHSIYPGIDLVYYGNESQLEYDLVVAPGSDPKKIALAFEGDIESFSSDRDGSLSVRTRSGIVQLRPPRTYQQSSSGAHVVGSRFVVEGHIVHFAVDHYDETKTLTIDPVLIYSTYLGGSGEDASDGRHSIALDASGNTYIVGRTTSTDFPLGVAGTSTPYSAFVVKLNSSGSGIDYKTYLGTSGVATAVAADASGIAYVTGETEGGFPTTNGAPQPLWAGKFDAFFARMTPSGTLQYATYLGGSGPEFASAVAIDASGGAVLTGSTASTDFPTLNAYQPSNAGLSDAYITKINPDGSVLYSTYLGGSADDGGGGVAMDITGSIYVTGTTYSSDFPLQNALQSSASGGNAKAFVTKMNPSASELVYSTYLGGSLLDQGSGIAVDASGSAYVVGMTASGDFPGAVPLHPPGGDFDGFVVKLSPSGGTLIYSRYIGGTGWDWAGDVALDSSGNAYITGETDSDVSLFTPDPVQPARAGSNDAFLLKMDPAGSVRLWTYLGGSDIDSGSGVAVDASGNALIAVSTFSTNFPTASAIRPSYGGNHDVAVVKIGTASDLSVTIDSTASGAGPGATLTYFITVSNGGPASATGVVMHGFVPSGTALTSLTTTQGSCDPESSGHSLTCPLGTINAGNSVQIVLRVSVTGQNASSISALAWLTADSDDLFAANNVAQNAITLLTRRPGQITSQ